MSTAAELRDSIIGLPDSVTSVEVQVWQDKEGRSEVIVWGGSGFDPEGGIDEYEVFQGAEWDYDFRSDVEYALVVSGFTSPDYLEDAEWTSYGFPSGTNSILTATR